jgi:hypothetical protein
MATNLNEMAEPELIQHIAQKVDKMFTYLCGDEGGGITGVVERVRILEKKVAEFERLKWKLIGISSIATPILILVWEMLKQYLMRKI